MSDFVSLCYSLICKLLWINYLGGGERELICLLLFTCNYVVSFQRGFLFLCVLGRGYVILL